MSTATAILESLPLPLRRDDSGTIRVGDTRVSLDTIIAYFHQDCSAEIIAAKFPTVGLDNVYLTIGHYLNRREEMDRYLKEQEREAAEIRAKLEPYGAPPGTREMLIERLKKRAAS